MNWKQPPTAIFWVPVPDEGQSRMKAVEWRFYKDAPRLQMEINDPDTNQPYTVEILDFFGAFDINRLPDWLARQVTDKDQMTGKILGTLLRRKTPEFRKAQKVLFYQVTTTLINDSSKEKAD